MSSSDTVIRFITDGTFSVEEKRPVLSRHGELVAEGEGGTRFVPDDPGFPATLFRPDGIIEMAFDASTELRLEAYVDTLAGWLGVSLQRIESA
jgi:hypothetical protein